MVEQKDVMILAIESSCDETAASVVKNGREVLSNVISSQIELHKLYGGVVPEIASRKHIEKINQVIEEALSEAKVTLDDIDAIGVTYGPGLVGALLVGVAEAKAIAYAKNLPLVGVHHIEGHISANFIENKELEPPFVCLVVSGGHTHLVCVKDYGKYEIIGCPVPASGGGRTGRKTAEIRGQAVSPLFTRAHLYTVAGVVRPAGGCCALRARWGATLPKPLVSPAQPNTRFASVRLHGA